MQLALDQVDASRESPSLQVLAEGEGYWERLHALPSLCSSTSARRSPAGLEVAEDPCPAAACSWSLLVASDHRGVAWRARHDLRHVHR